MKLQIPACTCGAHLFEDFEDDSPRGPIEPLTPKIDNLLNEIKELEEKHGKQGRRPDVSGIHLASAIEALVKWRNHLASL